MKEIGCIFLSWRIGVGYERHIVGVIKKSVSKGYSFSYIKDGVEKAKEEGFAPYTEFPDISKTYTQNVLETFSQRLTKSDRSDIQDFYSFWEIKPQYKDDKYYLLAHTMGLLPTDNFELLADYRPIKDLSFMTDLAGMSKLKLPAGSVKAGDCLSFEPEAQNKHDKHAVKVFKDGTPIGYIKKIHSKVLHSKRSKEIKLIVKAVDQNGFIKRIFVKVSF